MAKKEHGSYYVFEMSKRDRKQPLRQVNLRPLTLDKAKQLARIGAQKGKHDRAVTTSPRSVGFRIVAQYSAGSGKDVAIMYRRGKGGGGRRARRNPAQGEYRSNPGPEPAAAPEPEPELGPHIAADEV